MQLYCGRSQRTSFFMKGQTTGAAIGAAFFFQFMTSKATQLQDTAGACFFDPTMFPSLRAVSVTPGYVNCLSWDASSRRCKPN